MALRQELEAEIAELQRKIAFWVNAIKNNDPAIENMHMVVAERLELLRIDLAVARDSLQLLNEEQCDIDRDAPFHSSDPIQNYLHDKMRF